MRAEKRIVQNWFAVWEPEPGLFAIQEPFHSEQVYSYLVTGSERALLVDTGTGIGDIRAVVDELTDRPVTLLNSHAHWDHIGGNWRFDGIWIHEAEAADLERDRDNAYMQPRVGGDHVSRPMPNGTSLDTITIPATRATRTLRGGETIDLGERKLRVLHAPGHSGGGLVIVDDANGFMLSTDVVYAGDLYAFGPDSSIDDYRRTLADLSKEVNNLHALYPSHNASPVEPEIIGRMQLAMEDIAAGRVPDGIENERAIFKGDGFGIIVRLDDPALGSAR